MIIWLFLGHVLVLIFCFGTAYHAIMFVVATGTTISCSLGRQYRPVLSLSFLDVYEEDETKERSNTFFKF
jgi:hypothetical protein